MALNRLLTYTLLLLSLHLSGQGLLIEQNGQLIRFDTPTGTTDSLMMFEFDPVEHSRLAFLSDTSNMQLRWSNGTAYVVKWYDVSKRDSLVQATEARQPRFDFADGSVRFDGGQWMTSAGGYTFLNDFNDPRSIVMQILPDAYAASAAQNWFTFVSLSPINYSAILYQRLSEVNFETFNYTAVDRIRGGVAHEPQKFNFIVNQTDIFIDGAGAGSAQTGPSINSPSQMSIGGISSGRWVSGNLYLLIVNDFALNKGQRILTNKYLQK